MAPQKPLRLPSMAAKPHIPQIPSLRIPRSKGPVNLFHIFYTPLFAPWRLDWDHLSAYDVFYSKLLDKYENMPKDTLRWQVVANTAVKEVPKAVMRERLRRRVREAFHDALKQMGYESNGRVWQPGRATDTPLQDLRGTLEIHCRGRAGLDCEFVEIVNLAKSALSTVDRSLNQSKGNMGNAGPEGQWWKRGITDFKPSFSSITPTSP